MRGVFKLAFTPFRETKTPPGWACDLYKKGSRLPYANEGMAVKTDRMENTNRTAHPALWWNRTFLFAERWPWFGRVAALFLATRTAWILIAAFARQTFLPNPTYQGYLERGGFLTRYFLLDIFANWDSKFYLSIIKDGYVAPGNLAEQYSNLAFFPLYPYLVKSIGWLGVTLPDSAYLAIGILLSNGLFLASMGLLYYLATHCLKMDDAAAFRSMALMFVFPTSFFFASFYTESLFLFFALTTFALAHKERWFWAAAAAALAVLTRPQGVLVSLALAWMYMSARGWNWRSIRLDVLWQALGPLLLLLHFAYTATLSGDFFAPITAQLAWGRNQSGILAGWWANLNGPGLDVFKLDAVLAVLFLAGGLILLVKYPAKVWGIFAVLMVVVPVSTGSLVSLSRFLALVFPVFLLAGERLKNREAYGAVFMLSLALQTAYFIGWVNYYWIA